MKDDELDVAVAEQVFGVSREIIEAWPWGVPAFSSDRQWSAGVVGCMLAHPARELFDVELERAAIRWGWKAQPEYAGAGALVLVLTPEEICKAALAAIRGCAGVELT